MGHPTYPPPWPFSFLASASLPLALCPSVIEIEDLDGSVTAVGPQLMPRRFGLSHQATYDELGSNPHSHL